MQQQATSHAAATTVSTGNGANADEQRQALSSPVVPRAMPLTPAEEGIRHIRFASTRQAVMTAIRDMYLASQPLKGRRVLLCSHLRLTTGYCALILRDLGARVMVCGSNKWSTRDDVVAALNAEPGIEAASRHGAPDAEFFGYLRAALAWGPDLIADDGAELLAMMHGMGADSDCVAVSPRPVRGACEQTTTGVVRLREIQEAQPDKRLLAPVIGVNECKTKHLIDNRYGSGESCLTAIICATNCTLRGRVIVVVGYGHVGRGLAAQARGMGARVIVTEHSPIAALEAHMEGFEVMRLAEAVKSADFVITATGYPRALRADAIASIKDGAFLCNAGHLETEIDVEALAKAAASVNKRVAENVDEYVMDDGGGSGIEGGRRRRIYLIADGHTCNVATGRGHSADIIDITFGLKLRSVLYLAEKAWPAEGQDAAPLENKLQNLPADLDASVARIALASRGMQIDERD
ncbi:Formate/glycerate dehydrogenase [Pandoravirus salinus]|uniref:Formate/glycerate dehydrogenase n=1 Tax=Pandoravirus salinus TaxID=1349410 RepID=S4W1G4_9VIRU|nr:Formate/glycerate dehydrogenase [Pandoravirus salinus]AGO85641.1 Formate/glycerate dehydrogenase [Pandoravirus salinus]